MKLLDVVALLEDLPELGLSRGQVGTIVEEYEPFLRLNLVIWKDGLMPWKYYRQLG